MGIVYDDKAVDALLDRSQGSGEDGPDENLLANEYLSQFKVRRDWCTCNVCAWSL